MRPLFSCLILCACLTGCGQKGALYIPQNEAPKLPAAVAEAEAEVETDAEAEAEAELK